MIKSIEFDGRLLKQYGLQSGRMSRLGKIVALTGPNGAGKSRLLRLVQKQWANYTNASAKANLYRGRVSKYATMLSQNPQDNRVESKLQRAQHALRSIETEMARLDTEATNCRTALLTYELPSSVVNLHEISPKEIQALRRQISNSDFKDTLKALPVFLRDIVRQIDLGPLARYYISLPHSPPYCP